MIEVAIVFILPIILALVVNKTLKKKSKPNERVLFYKLFLFSVILVISSQIIIPHSDSTCFTARVIGNLLMMILIFDMFLTTSDDSHPNTLVIVPFSILWFVIFVYLASFYTFHIKNLQNDVSWKCFSFSKMDASMPLKCLKKLYLERALPKVECHKLPICNIFSCTTKM